MKNISKTIMYVIIAISVAVLGLFFFMRGSDGAYGELSDISEFNGLDLLLWWAYFILLASILTAVVMSVINISKNPGGAKRGLLGILILAVVVGVAWAISNTDPVAIGGGKKLFTDKLGLRIADIGLYASYFAMIAAVGAVIWGGIKNSFK